MKIVDIEPSAPRVPTAQARFDGDCPRRFQHVSHWPPSPADLIEGLYFNSNVCKCDRDTPPTPLTSRLGAAEQEHST